MKYIVSPVLSLTTMLALSTVGAMNRLATASQLPDQTGRTAVITGANSGIGFAAATALAARGARVIVATRDPDKGRAAAERIGSGAEPRHLDLSSLASVREFSAAIEGPSA